MFGQLKPSQLIVDGCKTFFILRSLGHRTAFNDVKQTLAHPVIVLHFYHFDHCKSIQLNNNNIISPPPLACSTTHQQNIIVLLFFNIQYFLHSPFFFFQTLFYDRQFSKIYNQTRQSSSLQHCPRGEWLAVIIRTRIFLWEPNKHVFPLNGLTACGTLFIYLFICT